MNKLHLFFNSILVLVLLSPEEGMAQSVPVGSPILEDYYRRAQILGQIDSSISFTVRPVFPSQFLRANNTLYSDSTLHKVKGGIFNITHADIKKNKIQFLPFTWQQQYNSHHPYGWNDGAMIPARGYQTVVSAGIFAKLGPFSIQLQPELLYAENKKFDGFPAEYDDATWERYYNYLNDIDLPEKFGEGIYSKILFGQSSIRLTVGPVSLGLSNENLWWGPGIRSSLLMSNNSRGFKHVTLNTIRPIKTKLGSIEGQIISGRLDASGFTPDLSRAGNIYVTKPDDWRYLSGMVISYQPKWVPGLFLGMTRAFQVYSRTMGNNFDDFIPLFSGFQKKNVTNEDAKKRDQLTSVFVRWLWLKSLGEIYFEYGRNDHSYDTRDFLLEPGHTRAYLLGLKKLFPLTKKDEHLQLNIEVTQMSENVSTQNRYGGSWYSHYQIKHGYTHYGEVLGAGIGPGSGLQSIDLSWVKRLRRIGLQLERYLHNDDFYYDALIGDTRDIRRHWVDLSAGGFADWNYKNLFVNAEIKVIHSLNYEYFRVPDSSNPWAPGHDVYNFHGTLGISYRF